MKSYLYIMLLSLVIIFTSLIGISIIEDPYSHPAPFSLFCSLIATFYGIFAYCHGRISEKKDSIKMRVGENGGIFLYILLACVLMGSLFFVYSRQSSTSTNAMTTGSAKTAAVELLDYTSRMVTAIQKMQTKGCSENQISFDTPPKPPSRFNPNSPSDETCHVFLSSGGRIKPLKIVSWKGYDSKALPLAWPTNEIFYVAGMSIAGNGPTNNQGDLGMWIANIHRDVCKQINSILGIENNNGEPPVDNTTQLGGSYFVGNYPAGNRDRQLWGTGNEFVGKPAGCYSSTNFNLVGCPGCKRYYFAATLIAR